MANNSAQVQAAAARLREAEHVAKVMGGNTARRELDQARTAMVKAANVKR